MTNSKKLVYIGNQIDVLKYIHSHFYLNFVFIEDAPRNISVLRYCQTNHIKYTLCKKSIDLSNYCNDNNVSIDLCITCHLGIILKNDFIKKCHLIVNLHTGNLRTNRGGQPLYHNIINNDFFSCLTAHTIESATIDSGRIISEVNVPINYSMPFITLLNNIYIHAESIIKYIITNYYKDQLVLYDFDFQSSIYREMFPREVSDIILNAKSLDEGRSELYKIKLC